MTKLKHTPGPWTVEKGHNNDVKIYPDHGRGSQIARAYITPAGGAETRLANAHLISAAPDLLAALELCSEYLAECHALDKSNGHYGDDLNESPCSYCDAFEQARAAIAKAKGETP